MKRDDVLKDIEQKLRALGYSDEKDLEILKNIIFNYFKKEQDQMISKFLKMNRKNFQKYTKKEQNMKKRKWIQKI